MCACLFLCLLIDYRYSIRFDSIWFVSSIYRSATIMIYDRVYIDVFLTWKKKSYSLDDDSKWRWIEIMLIVRTWNRGGRRRLNKNAHLIVIFETAFHSLYLNTCSKIYHYIVIVVVVFFSLLSFKVWGKGCVGGCVEGRRGARGSNVCTYVYVRLMCESVYVFVCLLFVACNLCLLLMFRYCFHLKCVCECVYILFCLA